MPTRRQGGRATGRQWLSARPRTPSSVAAPARGGNPNAVTDVAGTFLGLLTFVGGPVILWFALTYEQLRGVWRLS